MLASPDTCLLFALTNTKLFGLNVVFLTEGSSWLELLDRLNDYVGYTGWGSIWSEFVRGKDRNQ